MNENEKNAARMREALTNFSKNPENIENFCLYLEHHFSQWLTKYASTPEGLTEEMQHFSKML